MEFYDHRHAAASLAAMNGRKIMGKVSYRIYRVSGDGCSLDWKFRLCAFYKQTENYCSAYMEVVLLRDDMLNG